MNSFTRIFNCDASNITGLVDGLEQKGLAARFPDTHDRRIKMIKLSSKGEKLRQQLVVLLDEDGRSSLASLKPSEINNFNKLLSRITEPIVL